MGLLRLHRVTLLFIFAIATFSMGCGTGGYNEQMETTTKKLKRLAPFTQLNAPTEIPGTSVKIGIPKILTRFLTVDTEDPSSPTGKINPERVKPSILKPIPGTFCAYDAEGEMPEGKKATMACQIAVIPSTAPEAAALPTLIKTGMGLVFGGKPVEFEEAIVDTHEDSKITWQKLHVEGDLLYDVKDGGGATEMKKIPALVEVWWHEGKHYHTLLIWRAPKEVDDKVKLMELAPIAAGTLTEAAPPEPAKPEAGAPKAG
jgi:hypothetical protein